MRNGCLKVVQLTDTHIFSDSTRRLGGLNPRDSFLATLEKASVAIRNSDLVLLTGDLAAEGEMLAYRWLVETLASFETPIYCLPGNHDIGTVMAPIVSAGGWTYGGSHVIGGWNFVLLDSCVADAEYGRLGEAELARLETTLSRQRDLPTLICLHHHPVPMESAWMDTMLLADNANFWSIVKQNPQVSGVLWGHVHQNFDTFKNGARLLASPSTCVQFAARSTNFALDPLAPGFRILRLFADGNIDTEITRVEQ